MHGMNRNAPPRVLVVDDEPFIRDLLARWLCDERYFCETAGNAAIAWAHLQEHPVELAAPMHDIGKMAIPDAILCKPGKLTPNELATMQTHARLGARLLAGSRSPVLRMAHDIALCHHERWDGNGYPSGLKGIEIPEAARIVAVVDVYDALSHNRVYRPALPEQEVL
jgi:putative two-component system response regulator